MDDFRRLHDRLDRAFARAGDPRALAEINDVLSEGYAEALFSQMHYGVGPDLAARSLWLLALCALGAAGVGWLASGTTNNTNKTNQHE